MAFDIAISGMRAASDDLNVIGNNIANASTVGFKNSRAEFADVYAASTLGQAKNAIGSGVLMANVSQEFKQGSVSFTNNSLDMAINGEGFFTMSDGGSVSYTRAGYFSVNKDGVMVNNKDKHLQGFMALDSGAMSSQLSDITIQTSNINPSRTTAVEAQLNFPANAAAPEIIGTTANTAGAEIGVAQSGATNGYSSETITLTDANGTTQTLTTTANQSASSIASAFNNLNGVAADASTTATLSGINDAGGLQVRLNGVLVLTSSGAGSVTPASIASAINAQTNSNLSGVTASVSGTSVVVTSSSGEDLQFTITASGAAGDGMTVTGPQGAGVALAGNGTVNATVGGTVALTLDDGYTATSDGAGAELFAGTISQTAFSQNAFDANDPDTYNKSTNVTIYDSKGLSHDLQLYYVKQNDINHWRVYAQVDGANVGEPTTTAPNVPTLASYDIYFNNDGTLDASASDPIQITHWTPVGADGLQTGYAGLSIANGATFPPQASDHNSNFYVDLGGTTEYGSEFAQNNLSQDGFTTGRLSSLDIGSDGSIYARYTNGQSKVLAQVALTNFANPNGLRPVGDTSWVETLDSGTPIVGAPDSAAMGAIQGGALEESNVELSGELVDLIMAQRNFQANAKTIQTADAITQAIINIR